MQDGAVNFLDWRVTAASAPGKSNVRRTLATT